MGKLRGSRPARGGTQINPPGSFIVGDLVALLTRTLGDAGCRAARTEARDILAMLLDVPRFWPTQYPAEVVPGSVATGALAAAVRRGAGEPFAYAVGRAAFRHLTLDVDERVLIPRPETEQLVQIILEYARDTPGGTALDIGTGSGAIALALASEGRFDRVIGTDISTDALAVAHGNGNHLGDALVTPVEWRLGGGFSPVSGARARIVASNPPYVALSEAMNLPASVRDWEPAIALFGGLDGLSVASELIRGATAVLEPAGLLVLEVDARRASLVAARVAAHDGYRDIAVHTDLAGRERFVTARRADT
ncbi:MAG: peptide chain release factor N(5)-glutamine methyltransferase [Gemmatimonadaceae bacterium]